MRSKDGTGMGEENVQNRNEKEKLGLEIKKIKKEKRRGKTEGKKEGAEKWEETEVEVASDLEK